MNHKYSHLILRATVFAREVVRFHISIPCFSIFGIMVFLVSTGSSLARIVILIRGNLKWNFMQNAFLIHVHIMFSDCTAQ